MGDYLMSLIKANNITNTTGGIPTVKSQQLIPTVWVNFNGTGTVAIRDSEGVSSITDVSAGRYDVNFAVAMANANYCATATLERQVSWLDGGINVAAYATGSLRVENYENSTRYDTSRFNVMIMGGQA